MTREFLKALGLDDALVEKIVDEHGKGLTAEQKKYAQKEQELALVNGQLAEANKTIKSYKDLDIDAIKASAADWEKKAKQLETDKTNLVNTHRLEKALLATGTLDAELLGKAIDGSQLKYTEDKIVGLDEQIAALKTSKPYLFQKTAEKKEEDSRFKQVEPGASQGETKTEVQSTLDGVFGF